TGDPCRPRTLSDPRGRSVGDPSALSRRAEGCRASLGDGRFLELAIRGCRMGFRDHRGGQSPVRFLLLLRCAGAAFACAAPDALAAPASEELTAASRRHADAFFAQKSFKLVWRLDSEVHRGKEGFMYRTFTVTNVRRGSDLHTTILYPKGTLRGSESMPE